MAKRSRLCCVGTVPPPVLIVNESAQVGSLSQTRFARPSTRVQQQINICHVLYETTERPGLRPPPFPLTKSHISVGGNEKRCQDDQGKPDLRHPEFRNRPRPVRPGESGVRTAGALGQA